MFAVIFLKWTFPDDFNGDARRVEFTLRLDRTRLDGFPVFVRGPLRDDGDLVNLGCTNCPADECTRDE